MTISSGAQQETIKLKIAESNARIADLEAKARSKSGAQDVEGQPAVARKVRIDAIGGIVLLVCIVLAVFTLFFVL